MAGSIRGRATVTARRGLVILAGWVLVSAAFEGALLAIGAHIRAQGVDPRIADGSTPTVRNLRIVGENLLVGAQPTRDGYTHLARLGVDLVIDLRTGRIGDRRADDPHRLRELGLRLEWVPVPDGAVPDDAARERLARLIAPSRRAFVHCGGGVGRSSCVAALHEASSGGTPIVCDQLAVGPPSLAQLYFVAALARGEVAEPNLGITSVSRALDLPRRALSVVRGCAHEALGRTYLSRAGSSLGAR